ncbi:MAG: ATP-binding cassette domain-containing protein [Deltaproteobacteria bacterium]|nr:ATP-binding cassette domain-containing protein [Deltaproteobacteria bacterium]MBI3295651.1 ATP-binding cassette domain-containing protein [Deltaproteobacteria bacterium]
MALMTDCSLSMDSVGFSWGGRVALQSISFTPPQNQITVVTGPAGCGKSTLLRLLATLESDYRGAIRTGGRELLTLTRTELVAWRRQIGVMLNPLGNFDWLTAEGCLEFVIAHAGHKGLGGERAVATLSSVGLEWARGRFPHEMSGGMQKRLALARALVLSPRMLILDDPTAGLDPVTGREILDLIAGLRGSASIVLATSDTANVRRLADHVLFLVEGRGHFFGANEAFQKSDDPYIRQFLESRTEGPIS